MYTHYFFKCATRASRAEVIAPETDCIHCWQPSGARGRTLTTTVVVWWEMACFGALHEVIVKLSIMNHHAREAPEWFSPRLTNS